MTGRAADQPEDCLILRSRLSEMAQLPVWIERLASWHAIPENVAFAINLCLEEVVSNIILHGYGADADGSVIVCFTAPGSEWFVFIVEDQAQNFNPLDSLEPDPNAPVRVGGQGINFLRQFANELEYELTPTGNRLRIGFSAANTAS